MMITCCHAEFRATSTASWGSFVLLGGADGTLVRWDTATGHTAVIDSGCGRIHKIYVAPSPTNDGPPGSPGRGHMELARVAVLSASGTFAVFALDVAGQVQPTGVGWEAATSRVGRAIDIDWLAMPRPLGKQMHTFTVVE